MANLRGLTAVLAAIVCLTVPARAQDEIVLRVGVDPDAAPFSYGSDMQRFFDEAFAVQGPLFKAGYRGYVVQVCDAAMRQVQTKYSNVVFDPIPVTTRTRFGEERADWHILCDPASLTPNRSTQHEATLPIYLSGVGFANLPDLPKGETCQTIAGVASNTTTEHAGVLSIIRAGAIPRRNPDLQKAVNSADGNVLDCGTSQNVPIIAVKKTHAELARALCDGEILYYIGDLEIVRASLARIEGCNPEFSDTTYGDERYTIYTETSGLDPEQVVALNAFRAELSRQVLQIDSSLLRSYRAYLGNHKKSRKLSAFYWGVIGAFE